MVSGPGSSPATLATGYSLRPGEYMTVVYQASVDTPPSVDHVTNIASVTSALMPIPQIAAVTDQVARADLSVSKTVNNPTPTVGATIDYTIVLTNRGPHRALNVKLADVLPSALSYSNATPSSGTYDRVSGIWTVGTVAAYGSETLVLRAVLTNDDAYAFITITNWATITGSRTYDPVSTNHSSSALITPKSTFALVSDFRGVSDGDGVAVEWTTEIEVRTAGFYVHRQDTPGGVFTRVNAELVPAQLSGPQGGLYRLADPGATPGRKYRYKLEEVETDGSRNEYGPYDVAVGRKTSSPQKVLRKESRGKNAAAFTRQPRAISEDRQARNAARAMEVNSSRKSRG